MQWQLLLVALMAGAAEHLDLLPDDDCIIWDNLAFEGLVGFEISSQEQVLQALPAPPAPRYPNLARLIDWTITGDRGYLDGIPYGSPETFSTAVARWNNWVIPWLRRDSTTSRAAQVEDRPEKLHPPTPPTQIYQGQTQSQLQTDDKEYVDVLENEE